MLKTVGFPSTRTGNQTIVDGNLVIGTAGNGIDFSADGQAAGMTSELLDDYEEGTWTPAINGSGGNPTVGYASRVGLYTRVGRQVTVTLWMELNSYSGGSGNLSIGGLPFMPNTTTNAFGGSAIGNFSSINLDAGYTTLGGRIGPSATSISLTQSGDNIATAALGVAAFSASTYMAATFTYFA